MKTLHLSDITVREIIVTPPNKIVVQYAILDDQGNEIYFKTAQLDVDATKMVSLLLKQLKDVEGI